MEKETNKPSIRFAGFTDAWEQRKLNEIVSYASSSLSAKDAADDGKWNLYDANHLIGKTNLFFVRDDYITIIKDGAGVGRVRLLPKNSAFIGTMGALLPLNSDLLFDYALLTKADLSRKFSGSTIPHIYFKDYGNETYRTPLLLEQQKIGSLFERLDSLITLHQRECDQLGNIKKALLEKMFPSQNEYTPKIRFKGFTDAWEQRKLGDISEIKTGPFGSTLHADDYVSDGTPIITTEHFKTGALPRSKNGLPQVSDSDYKRLTAYTLDDGDIVFSRVGSVDINALITPFQSNWLFSGRVLRVRPQTDISSKFLHTRLETESIKTDIRTRAVGQTMPSINTEILKITPLVLPSSAAEQEQIGSYFAALDNLITLHQRKCEKLKNIKKSLLEKMFA